MKTKELVILLISNICGSIAILLFGYKSNEYFRILPLKNFYYNSNYKHELFNKLVLYSNISPLIISLMIIISFCDWEKYHLNVIPSLSGG